MKSLTVNFISSRQVELDREVRLQAVAYREATGVARDTLEAKGYPVVKIGDVVREVFNPPRFKRVRVQGDDHGVPYLTGAQMMEARPPRSSFISRSETKDLQRYLVQRDWLLITDSGTIGLVTYVMGDLEGCAITNNVIRVVPNPERALPGYIYAYLTSPEGQELIKANTYGSVINHIEPHHVYQLPMPLPPLEVQQAIHDKVHKAFVDRAAANIALADADAMFADLKV